MEESFTESDSEEIKDKRFNLIRDMPLVVVGVTVIAAYTCFQVLKKIKR